MIYSADDNSPYFHKRFYGSKTFINGTRMAKCYAVDTTLGVAYCYHLGNDARPYVIDGEVEKVEYKGDIKFTLAPRPYGLTSILTKLINIIN